MPKHSFYLLVIILSLVIFYSCSNWKVEPAVVRMMFIHASPVEPAVSIFIDNQNVGIPPLNNAENTNYLEINAGKQNIKYSRNGNTGNGSVGEAFINKDLFLTEFRNYSLFLTKKPDKTDSLLVYPDTLTTPTVGNTRLRFANLYQSDQGEEAFNLIIHGPDTITFLNRKFINISTFLSLDADTSYVVKLVLNKDTILRESIRLASERAYTIMAVGKTNPPATDPVKVQLKLIEHR